MERIYTVDDFPQDLRAFMDDRESEINDLERAVYRGFFEAYDVLLKPAAAQDQGYILDLFSDCPFVIIADSRSVREAALLERSSQDQAWDVKREGFSVLPSPR